MNFIFRIVFTDEVFPLPKDQSYNSFFCVICFGSSFSSLFPADKGFMVFCVNKSSISICFCFNTLHHKTLLSENSHDRCLPCLSYLSLVVLPSIDAKWNLIFSCLHMFNIALNSQCLKTKYFPWIAYLHQLSCHSGPLKGFHCFRARSSTPCLLLSPACPGSPCISEQDARSSNLS